MEIPFEISIRPSGVFSGDLVFMLPERLKNLDDIVFIEKTAYQKLERRVSFLEHAIKIMKSINTDEITPE